MPGGWVPVGSLAGSAVSALFRSVVAGQILSGHRLVIMRSNGKVTYASNADLSDMSAPLWLTDGAAVANASVNVLMFGTYSEPSWSWTPGPLYLGQNGLITQTPPASPGAAFLVQVGYATTATSIVLDQRQAIRLI